MDEQKTNPDTVRDRAIERQGRLMQRQSAADTVVGMARADDDRAEAEIRRRVIAAAEPVVERMHDEVAAFQDTLDQEATETNGGVAAQRKNFSGDYYKAMHAIWQRAEESANEETRSRNNDELDRRVAKRALGATDAQQDADPALVEDIGQYLDAVVEHEDSRSLIDQVRDLAREAGGKEPAEQPRNNDGTFASKPTEAIDDEDDEDWIV